MILVPSCDARSRYNGGSSLLLLVLSGVMLWVIYYRSNQKPKIEVQTRIYKTLHKEHTIEQHEPHSNTEVHSGIPEWVGIFLLLMTVSSSFSLDYCFPICMSRDCSVCDLIFKMSKSALFNKPSIIVTYDLLTGV
jgi:hypothetical protein